MKTLTVELTHNEIHRLWIALTHARTHGRYAARETRALADKFAALAMTIGEGNAAWTECLEQIEEAGGFADHELCNRIGPYGYEGA